MAKEKDLQFYRGTEANRSGVTPLAGEPLWTTDTDHTGQKLYMGDGSTAGGHLMGPIPCARPGHASGYYFFPIGSSVVGTGTFNNTGRVEYSLFACGGTDPVTFDKMAVEVSTAGGGGDTVRMGVYSATSDGLPGTLLEESSAISVSTTGKKEHTFSGSGLTLYPGFYYLACQSDSSTAVFYRSQGDYDYGLLMIFDTASFSTARKRVIQETHTYGALPTTATVDFIQNNAFTLVGMHR